ncbi:hypothetical protein CBS63078_2609 [Aspergillus niger]|uniref:Uncharacterized protein n=2 Tax=Aspergillus TaxID=5052 RepID=A0A370PIL0_ASPPH|nr:hypothetical protein CBS13152_8564 [Aspergillus niger]RDK42042.1 hypothetical protein M752DRAFT_235335 [Aspergillus phoenicis ATCC 13157]KAI2923061.1 hypothetical protein CBS63078_2609 [Aspergillus niger]KAI3010509.1 hypothetical protein CBS147346_1722 [Aspergillus niger]KAI3033190.1 hypothetical protein CBS147347_1111 [Aspergillus niger]
MGDNNNSSFLYGYASSNRFYGSPEPPFNPKAVTQASWTRPEPKPELKGPLVDHANTLPDVQCNTPSAKPRWTPMSPKTKGRVVYGRKVQLALRVLALAGAIGSLFCSIVIKNAAVTVIWIVRVGPAVAILHTLYGIYTLSRSSITRPPGSQASYMFFAATFDLGLIPFYVFSAYLGYGQYTDNAYDWTTMLGSDVDMTTKIAEATFLLGIINGALHAISLGISIFLGTIFRKITRLPPDMNPLEDNLTARPFSRAKSEIIEKRASKSTLGSDNISSEDPLIGVPRSVPFMDTRSNPPFNNDYSRFPPTFADRTPPQHTRSFHRPSRIDTIPHLPFHQPNDIDDATTIASPIENPDIFTRATTSIPRGAPVREPSPDLPNRSQCVSPASENWIVYPSRSTTPVEEAKDEHPAPRDPSSVYSRAETPASSKGGVMDWFSPQRYGLNIGEAISENKRGEYESIAANEFYGNDDDVHDILYRSGFYDNAEQDLGDHRIDIFQDHEELDEDTRNSLKVNPLALNPPSPLPKPDEVQNRTPSNGRMALTDIPNLSPKPPAEEPLLDSLQKKGSFYGELPHSFGLDTPRKVSHDQSKLTPKKNKLNIKKSQKSNAYGALKQHDDGDLNGLGIPYADPVAIDGDRKGRVVSNSGADATHANSSLSYGNYIAGLGVGRRRDVSGKMAEEGRVETSKPKNENATPIRAAGWARFAGL